MKSKTKTALLLFILISATWLAGCKKTSSANTLIVGTWNATTYEEKEMAGAELIYDDIENSVLSGLASTVTFTANGNYSNSLGYSAKYYISNDTLYIQTVYGDYQSYLIQTLTAHSLTEGYIFTTYPVSDTVYTNRFNFTR